MQSTKRLLAFLLLLCSVPSWAAFTLGAANGNNSSSSSSLAMASTLNVAAGDTVVCSISTSGQTLNAVTPSVGSAFTKTATINTAGGSHEYTAWTLSASASATYNVTVTTTGGPNEVSFACLNATPPASSIVTLDVSLSAAANTVSLSAVTAGDLVIGGMTFDSTGSPTAGSGYTIPTNGIQPSSTDVTTHQPTSIEYNLNATGGTTTVNYTKTGNTAIWGLAFKATATGVTTNCTIALLGAGPC